MPLRAEVWGGRPDPAVGSEIAKQDPVSFSTNIVNERRRTVVVVPLSSSPRPVPPLQIPVRCGSHEAIAVTDQIRAVSKQRFCRFFGSVTRQELEAVERGAREILELVNVAVFNPQ